MRAPGDTCPPPASPIGPSVTEPEPAAAAHPAWPATRTNPTAASAAAGSARPRIRPVFNPRCPPGRLHQWRDHLSKRLDAASASILSHACSDCLARPAGLVRHHAGDHQHDGHAEEPDTREDAHGPGAGVRALGHDGVACGTDDVAWAIPFMARVPQVARLAPVEGALTPPVPHPGSEPLGEQHEQHEKAQQSRAEEHLPGKPYSGWSLRRQDRTTSSSSTFSAVAGSTKLAVPT